MENDKDLTDLEMLEMIKQQIATAHKETNKLKLAKKLIPLYRKYLKYHSKLERAKKRHN